MKKTSVSSLKEKCLILLDQVFRVTHFAKTTSKLLAAPAASSDWMGSMKDAIEIFGDIVSPANNESEWEVLR